MDIEAAQVVYSHVEVPEGEVCRDELKVGAGRVEKGRERAPFQIQPWSLSDFKVQGGASGRVAGLKPIQLVDAGYLRHVAVGDYVTLQILSMAPTKEQL